MIFWVNLARKDKKVEPTALLLEPGKIRELVFGDAIVRVLVGEGSSVELATPGLVYDVRFPQGGSTPLDAGSGYRAFAYVLDGEATFGSNGDRAKPPQLVLLGAGDLIV